MIQPHFVKVLNAAVELMATKWADEGPERHDEPSLTLAFPGCNTLLMEAVSEFGNEVEWNDGAKLLQLCFESIEPGVLLCAVTALRRCVDDVLGPAVEMLGFKKYGDKNLNRALRWVAASTIGLCGARAREARPALLKRLAKERHPRVRAAVLWSLGELGGHSAADHATLVTSLLFARCGCVQGAGEVALNADLYCSDVPWWNWGSTRPFYALYLSEKVSEAELNVERASCATLGGRESGR